MLVDHHFAWSVLPNLAAGKLSAMTGAVTFFKKFLFLVFATGVGPFRRSVQEYGDTN
jgi:hypothetical protein